VNRLATRLRIGEKIGLGFGAVGLLLLGAVAYCYTSLSQVIGGYQELHTVYGKRQASAFAIESRLTGMLSAAERFLLTREPAYADEAREQAAALAVQAAALAAVDAASRRTAEQLTALTDDFRARFDAIVEGWRIRGLDEDSGLQGAFRDAAHELEARAGEYNVDRPYLLLLQVRRREKDLGLRREPGYQQQVHALLDEMAATVAGSTLSAALQRAITAEIAAYRTALDRYAETVLAGEAIDGGKGPFRDAAHRIEDLLRAHYVPGLEAQVLQVRRREKDYLLRGDQRYVTLVDALLSAMHQRVAASAVAEAEKSRLLDLLDAYRRDFHALVDQDLRIASLTAEMYTAAARITPLVEANLADAEQQMARMSQEIAGNAEARARASLWVALIAAAAGTLFAVLITARIVRPVRRMAGMLDRLTRENPDERMPVDPHGRDEVNAMAIALNTLAAHKATFSNWWRTSMQEAIALRDRHLAQTDEERADAEQQLRDAAASKQRQIDAIHHQLHEQAERVGAIAERLDARRCGDRESADLRDAARDIRTLISVIDEP